MSADLPKYMKDVLKFPVYEVGLYSSLPYLGMWIFSLVSGFVSDFLIVRKFITITQARKIFTALGECYRTIKLSTCWYWFFCVFDFIISIQTYFLYTWRTHSIHRKVSWRMSTWNKSHISLRTGAVFPAVFILGASYAGYDKVIVVLLFTLAMGFLGNFYPGLKVNALGDLFSCSHALLASIFNGSIIDFPFKSPNFFHLDLSPNYAGSLMALTNGIGGISMLINIFIIYN